MTEQFQKESFQIAINWQASVLVLLLLPLVIALGFWQLDRAEEKRGVKNLYKQRQAAGSIDISLLKNDADLRHQPVSLEGEFIQGYDILLDNRVYQGRFGYEIITPFRLANNQQWVLVNRGWLAGDSSRRTIPSIEGINGVIQLQGEVYVPQGKALVLNESKISGWPRVQQTVDVEVLASELRQDIFPYVVRIKSNQLGAYQPSWIVVNVQPEKHVAYAFQWFSMGFALLVIGVLSNSNLWRVIKQPRE